MRWLRNKSFFILTSTILGAIMILFLGIPILGSLAYSSTGLLSALTSIRTLNAIATSFYCAAVATIFTLAAGVPLAYLTTRYEFFGKTAINALIDIPIIIPHNAAGIALLLALGPNSLIGGLNSFLGIGVVDTYLGIILAMAFVSAPYIIRSSQEAFLSVNPSMEKAAKSLGANNLKAFTYVTLPLASRGILTGCVLSWARAVSEFGAVVILAYYPKTVAVQLYDVFLSEGLSAAIPITGILIILSIILLVIFRKILNKPISPFRGG
jgi:molybdate/tungstate transport system permease protein